MNLFFICNSQLNRKVNSLHYKDSLVIIIYRPHATNRNSFKHIFLESDISTYSKIDPIDEEYIVCTYRECDINNPKASKLFVIFSRTLDAYKTPSMNKIET